MLNKSNLSQIGMVFLALVLAGLPISCSQYSSTQSFEVAAQIVAKSVDPERSRRHKIADLADKNYQFCTQSDPQDWRDGAGVCFAFAKIGNRVDGYYGYPH
ncbi:hypothetical protein [Nostoc sp. T09]|uniref:hypothetical protein n=1 Tax=Nostoc sp. T09 TaxID=1932621 RepID=UPI00211ACE59|nr:hypothetical protein [Nostoc sp. T09]